MDDHEFPTNELNIYHTRLQIGEFLHSPEYIVGCHTYICLSANLDTILQGLVTYDGIYFTMGLMYHFGLKKILETGLEILEMF